MKKEKEKQELIKKDWIFLTPRIISIIFILFLALFSLDVFGEGLSLFQVLVAFLMHNIPVFILAILLWISWKKEIVGAITFILAGIAYIFLTLGRNEFQWYMISWSLIIAGPAFFIGILFWIGWKRKKK
jgi:hypothetical protein